MACHCRGDSKFGGKILNMARPTLKSDRTTFLTDYACLDECAESAGTLASKSECRRTQVRAIHRDLEGLK